MLVLLVIEDDDLDNEEAITIESDPSLKSCRKRSQKQRYPWLIKLIQVLKRPKLRAINPLKIHLRLKIQLSKVNLSSVK